MNPTHQSARWFIAVMLLSAVATLALTRTIHALAAEPQAPQAPVASQRSKAPAAPVGVARPLVAAYYYPW